MTIDRPTAANDAGAAPQSVPRIEERLDAGTRVVETGRVRLSKRVVTLDECIDLPLLREEVEVRRVPIDRVVDAPPPTRREGEVTIVPVLEEVLVVSTQLVLREELHVSVRRSTVRQPQRVARRREEIDVVRDEAVGAPASGGPPAGGPLEP